MKKQLLSVVLVSMALAFSFGSCKLFHDMFEDDWKCNVNTIGTHDVGTDYYVETNFPEDVNKLVTREYKKDLNTVMEHAGFRNVDEEQANFRVVYGYSLGEVVKRDYVKTVTTTEWQPGTKTTTKTDVNSKSNGREGRKSENKEVTTTKTTEGKYVNKDKLVTVHEERQDITINIEAYDVKTNELIWATTITDNADPAFVKDLRKYMPMYLLNAMPYLGVDTKGEVNCSIYQDDERLKWF